MSKTLITGDQGFIGSHLKKEFPSSLGFDLKKHKNIIFSPLPAADVVIHLAAQTSVVDSIDDPVHDALDNIVGTIRLAKRYKKSRFIFASSGGAIQEKIESPYGLSKFCAEEYIKMLCDDYVILRFPNIYGEGSRSVVDKFINEEVTVRGDGSATRDYLHVSDLVRAIMASVYWPTGTYSLGTDTNTSVLEIANATGKEIEFVDKIDGELQHSYVKNTAPGWKAEVSVLEYVRENV